VVEGGEQQQQQQQQQASDHKSKEVQISRKRLATPKNGSTT
jgi:hypothetical protein